MLSRAASDEYRYSSQSSGQSMGRWHCERVVAVADRDGEREERGRVREKESERGGGEMSVKRVYQDMKKKNGQQTVVIYKRVWEPERERGRESEREREKRERAYKRKRRTRSGGSSLRKHRAFFPRCILPHPGMTGGERQRSAVLEGEKHREKF